MDQRTFWRIIIENIDIQVSKIPEKRFQHKENAAERSQNSIARQWSKKQLTDFLGYGRHFYSWCIHMPYSYGIFIWVDVNNIKWKTIISQDFPSTSQMRTKLINVALFATEMVFLIDQQQFL